MDKKNEPMEMKEPVCKCGIPNCEGHRMTKDGKAIIERHPHFDKKK